MAHRAFANGVSEVFAVVRLGNTRGVATARRVGMEWVGETDKYYGLTLQIYRLTAPDLDYPEPAGGRAPTLTRAQCIATAVEYQCRVLLSRNGAACRRSDSAS